MYKIKKLCWGTKTGRHILTFIVSFDIKIAFQKDAFYYLLPKNMIKGKSFLRLMRLKFAYSTKKP